MISLLQAATQGRGLYSVPEAAHYAKMPAATIRSWFFPGGHRRALRRGDIEAAEEKALSFLDFVEALAVRSLRVDYGVTLDTIRQAIQFAQDKFGKEYLFARADHQTLLDTGKQLHIILAGERDPIKLGGRGAGQASFQACIEGYMRDLEFDQHGIATLYTAFRFKEQKVVMNPAFRFGEPILHESGYPPEVLWRGALAEGSFERGAELYGVTVSAVEAAYRYCNGELGLMAA